MVSSLAASISALASAPASSTVQRRGRAEHIRATSLSAGAAASRTRRPAPAPHPHGTPDAPGPRPVAPGRRVREPPTGPAKAARIPIPHTIHPKPKAHADPSPTTPASRAPRGRPCRVKGSGVRPRGRRRWPCALADSAPGHRHGLLPHAGNPSSRPHLPRIPWAPRGAYSGWEGRRENAVRSRDPTDPPPHRTPTSTGPLHPARAPRAPMPGEEGRGTCGRNGRPLPPARRGGPDPTGPHNPFRRWRTTGGRARRHPPAGRPGGAHAG